MGDSISYTSDGLFGGDCLSCLMSKAAAGDADAQRALHFLACLTEFMACRMFTGNPDAACDDKRVRKMPKGVDGLFNAFDCDDLTTSGGKLRLNVSGLTTAIIEDVDWDDRGSGGGPSKKTP